MLRRLRPVIVCVALNCLLLTLCGCGKHFSIAAPAAPPIDPGEYTAADYNADVSAYKKATTQGADYNGDVAKQARNAIAYGLMTEIEVVYGDYYDKLFTNKSSMAVATDALTLGLSTAASIATNSATKTIFSALGTGVAGLGLSVDKNFFAQQTFPVIGLAMQTRRDKIRVKIISNLTLDVGTYPLAAAKRDLVAYFNAGTLASGLQELQEEAGAATAAAASTGGGHAPTTPTSLVGVPGNSQVSLLWTASARATSYNLYYSTSSGVTTANGTMISGIASNSYTQSSLTNGTTYYYVVTAVNVGGESPVSNEVSVTPIPTAQPALQITAH